jgi:hypothetical protein
MLITEVYGANGKPIELTKKEASHALALQTKYNNEFRNTLGFDLPITTLTAISKSVVEQKFFEIRPSEYMPVRVGENAWSDQILTYLGYNVAQDFEAGNLNTGSNQSRLLQADAGVTGVYNPVQDWAATISWTYIDLRKAAKSGNWDLIAQKETARKTIWDLGIQKIAFLGSVSNSSFMGYLTQSGVNSNTALITEYIKTMDATEFSAFVAGIVSAYRANSNYTAWPTQFIIPEADYTGLGVLVPGTVGTYPVTKMAYLLEAFKTCIPNGKDFKILPCAYADQANNSTGINKNRYVLSNYNENSGRMDIPVDYTNTLQNTLNGFQFESAAYGEYTGFLQYRPAEMLYFDWAA